MKKLLFLTLIAWAPLFLFAAADTAQPPKNLSQELQALAGQQAQKNPDHLALITFITNDLVKPTTDQDVLKGREQWLEYLLNAYSSATQMLQERSKADKEYQALVKEKTDEEKQKINTLLNQLILAKLYTLTAQKHIFGEVIVDTTPLDDDALGTAVSDAITDAKGLVAQEGYLAQFTGGVRKRVAGAVQALTGRFAWQKKKDAPKKVTKKKRRGLFGWFGGDAEEEVDAIVDAPVGPPAPTTQVTAPPAQIVKPVVAQESRPAPEPAALPAQPQVATKKAPEEKPDEKKKDVPVQVDKAKVVAPATEPPATKKKKAKIKKAKGVAVTTAGPSITPTTTLSTATPQKAAPPKEDPRLKGLSGAERQAAQQAIEEQKEWQKRQETIRKEQEELAKRPAVTPVAPKREVKLTAKEKAKRRAELKKVIAAYKKQRKKPAR